MSGSAAAPFTTPPGGREAFALTQTDQDTNDQNVVFTDTTCQVGFVRLNSVYTRPVVSLQGVTAGGTYTWNVVATAITTPGDYQDYCSLYNNRPYGDPYLDTSLTVAQSVTITQQ